MAEPTYFTFPNLEVKVPSEYEIDIEYLKTEVEKCGDSNQLGFGTYGEVYKCRYKNNWVALKHFKDSMGGTNFIKCPKCQTDNGEYTSECVKCNTSIVNETKKNTKGLRLIESVLVETKALTVVQHPNVGRLIGYSLQRPFCLVMELAERGSLISILKNEKNNHDYKELKWSLRLWVALQIINGVDWIHSHHIIHRDLNGANILVRADWSVMLVDFGAAKFKDRPTSGSLVAGSVRYLAPELCDGIKTYAADIYSFAMVMYELLTRDIPWPDETEHDLLEFVNTKSRRPPISIQLPKSSPAGYIDLMKNCWNQDEKKRPDSKQVLETLKGIYETQLAVEERSPYTAATLSYPESFPLSLSSSLMSSSITSTSSQTPTSPLSTLNPSSPSLSSQSTPPSLDSPASASELTTSISDFHIDDSRKKKLTD